MTVDVGSGKLVAVRQVVEQLVHIINPKVSPLFGAIAERALERVRVADIIQSHQQIGWKPETSLLEGLKRTVDWYSGKKRRNCYGVM